VSLTGDAGKALAYQLERKLFDNGHAATVLESQDFALMQAIKNAGLIGLCINSPAELADAVFDCNQHTIDDIYNALKKQKVIF
jgi:bifunctional enzyme CysN/CysC